LAAYCDKNLWAYPSAVLALGVCMQVDQGLLYGLKHLCLHSQHLLKSKQRGWWWIGFLVVASPIVFSIVGGDTVPCIDHLKYEDWWDKEYPKEWWQGGKG
jgi:hypothetical protein